MNECAPAAFTINGAARYSGTNRSRIYRWCNEGRLHPKRAGRCTMILRQELDDLIANLPAAPIRVKEAAAPETETPTQ